MFASEHGMHLAIGAQGTATSMTSGVERVPTASRQVRAVNGHLVLARDAGAAAVDRLIAYGQCKIVDIFGTTRNG